MNIYTWQDSYKYDGVDQVTLQTIVVAHIVGMYVARYNYNVDDELQWMLSIQTKERCWDRRFKTYADAVAQYDYINMLIANEK